MASLSDQLDKLPESFFLALNAAAGAFILLAHGGALLLVLNGKVAVPTAHREMIRSMVPFTLPAAALVAIGSLVGFASIGARRIVLSCQAGILCLSSVILLGWAASMAVKGIPPGNFAWTPGMLTGWVAYSLLLCSRFAAPGAWRRQGVVRYMPLLGTIVALPIDLAVFVRFVMRVSRL